MDLPSRHDLTSSGKSAGMHWWLAVTASQCAMPAVCQKLAGLLAAAGCMIVVAGDRAGVSAGMLLAV
jgi:hypothetical protein